MAVEITTRDGNTERRIVTAMIVSKPVLARIAPQWNGHLFRSHHSNVLASLCVDFYKKHSDAPGKVVDSLYDVWASSQGDTGRADDVGKFLRELDGEYLRQKEETNSEHILDTAAKFFRDVRLEFLSNEIAVAINAKDMDRADTLVSTYRKVEIGTGSTIDMFVDREELKVAFDVDDSDLLVKYPGALGRHFSDDLSRDSFVVFQGSDKSGKSFWIQDIAWKGMCSRRKVAYFEAGDLSRKQVFLRFMVRAAVHPDKSTKKGDEWPLWPCEVQYPLAMSVGENEKSKKRRGVITDSERMIFDRPLDYEKAFAACDNVMNNYLKSNRPYFKLSVHSNDSLSVDMVNSVLDGYAADDWVPDIVVIDYADIMAAPGAKDERDGINKNWQRLRKLSQELHCLVVTATQADAAAYDQEIQTKRNFSGDKRKNAHITAMHAINVTDDEKESKVCRLNVIARRDGEYNPKRCVHVAQCLALGQPAVLSSF